MAAGLGFKTFTTGEVLSAANVNGYLMQGVLVFASAAARDSAITSPQEGQFAYLKDTNVTTYYTGSAWANLDTTGMTNPMTTTGDSIYSSSGSTPARLGIGSTGQVLTVASGLPSWATPTGAASDYSLINSGGTALTGASTVTVSGISGMNKLHIFIAGASTSGTSPNIGVRLNGDTSGLYQSGGAFFTGSTSYAKTYASGAFNTAATFFFIAVGSDNADYETYGSVWIDGANSTGHKFMAATVGLDQGSGVNGKSSALQGMYRGTSAVSSVSLFSSGSNFDAGTLYVYGSAN